MADRLAGRRALVYGGGTGIGLACAEAFAAAGAAVFLTGRRAERLAAAASRMAADTGCKAGHEAGDATVARDVERITEAALDFLGGLDIVLISSGTSGVGSIFDTTVEEFRRICDTNLLSTFLATRAAAPHLVASGHGSVIAIASMYGVIGQYERVAYCASKAGVLGMVRAMALDFSQKGVRVNAINPGFIETELALTLVAQAPDPAKLLAERRAMHPIPRSGQPADIGAAAVYLAGDESSFVTGQMINVDGGYTIR